MTGELLGIRRAMTGLAVAEVGATVDRRRNKGGQGTSNAIQTTAASSLIGTLITGSATPHTKGSPTELVASTAFDVESVDVICRGVALTATDTSVLVDIVTGASLNVVLIPNLMTGYAYASGGYYVVFGFPLYIPAGTRIGAQLQGTEISETEYIAVRLHASGLAGPPGTTVTAIGVNTATSNGVLLTAPGSTNTKGAYATVLASTTESYKWIMVAISTQGTNVSTTEGLIDIATGAAASEVVLIPDLPFAGTAAEELKSLGCTRPFRVDIPAGTRLSARYAATTTATGSRPSIALYGVN